MLAQGHEPSLPYSFLPEGYDAADVWCVDKFRLAPRSQVADFVQEIWKERGGQVDKVLDLCCGSGLLLRELLQRGYDVTGLDRSAAQLRQAERKIRGQERARLVRSELPAIALEEQFDAVVSTGALVHLPNDVTLLRTFENVHRLLRPGGTFVFDMYTKRHAESLATYTTPTARVIEDGPFTLLMSITRTAIEGTYNWHGLMYLREENSQVYVRRSETHQLYAWPQEQIAGLGARAGFRDIEVFDNFTRQPTGSQTVCETYVMVR
ncbi:class I SAM-dependent methyltransferase [Streptomyces marincola]|uniref:Methyltransferase domain-containing protein n=1 Tax=Streptomyces marincola TaxID=2878388 RepID=A0A1W7D4N9_9ACTN|nr:class I SAM-dependent methyltransferase [Streptomyces marincola]ARQ71964.1 hypothetical protein CAG99_26830 [Streptomyces marincola]